jgi:uncharacterized membrane protein
MTTLSALTVLAQHTQETQGGGVGTALIVGTIVLVVVLLALIRVFFRRSSRASRGGVEPPQGERRRGNPPFEGIERGG